MPRIGILEMGRPAPEVVVQYGHAPRWFRGYFGEQPELTFADFPVFENGHVPDVKECDAWIMTGSSHSVYENVPWFPPMHRLIRHAVEQDIPVLGICFGHQLMAQALGGKVEKSLKGRGIGIHRHELTDAGRELFKGLDALHLVAAHQDQVVVPAPGSRLLATSPFCENAAFSYGPHALSLQGHPEILKPFALHVIHSWQESDPIDPKLVQAALHSLDTLAPDAPHIQPVLTRFLKKELIIG